MKKFFTFLGLLCFFCCQTSFGQADDGVCTPTTTIEPVDDPMQTTVCTDGSNAITFPPASGSLPDADYVVELNGIIIDINADGNTSAATLADGDQVCVSAFTYDLAAINGLLTTAAQLCPILNCDNITGIPGVNQAIADLVAGNNPGSQAPGLESLQEALDFAGSFGTPVTDVAGAVAALAGVNAQIGVLLGNICFAVSAPYCYTVEVCGIDGCTDATACNFDAAATNDDGSCLFVGSGVISTTSATTICVDDGADEPIDVMIDDAGVGTVTWVITDPAGLILGLPSGSPFVLDGAGVGVCTIYYVTSNDAAFAPVMGDDINALVAASVCTEISIGIDITREECTGCTDPCDPNFDATATVSDAALCAGYDTTCDTDVCTNGGTTVWDAATCSCIADVATVNGCTDAMACNFDATANCDDGSCDAGNAACADPCNPIMGCTDATACNFNAAACVDDASCEFVSCAGGCDLYIAGIIDATLSGGTPKGLQLCASADIADLSVYGIESVSNGGGSGGVEEFTFPADVLATGECVWIATESTQFNTFFGFNPCYTDGVMSVNGDDAIILYCNGAVIDVVGDPDTDGTGQPWEYLDGWAFSNDAAGNPTFDDTEWTYSGPNALDGATDNATSGNPYPSTTVNCAAVAGCTDPCADNYDAAATTDDGTCNPYDMTCDTDICTNGGTYVWDAAACGCVLDVATVEGCTDATACNFDSAANCDDGSCVPGNALCADPCNPVMGCIDATACNYDATACVDDGSCVPGNALCADPCNPAMGCTDATACNYDSAACIDDGSCTAAPCNPGCTDPCAPNYDATADSDDGTCDAYDATCNSDCNLGDITIWDAATCSCMVQTVTVSGCTNAFAINFDPTANCDDNSCMFEGANVDISDPCDCESTDNIDIDGDTFPDWVVDTITITTMLSGEDWNVTSTTGQAFLSDYNTPPTLTPVAVGDGPLVEFPAGSGEYIFPVFYPADGSGFGTISFMETTTMATTEITKPDGTGCNCNPAAGCAALFEVGTLEIARVCAGNALFVADPMDATMPYSSDMFVQFDWFDAAGMPVASNVGNPYYSPSVAGVYTVVVTDLNTCSQYNVTAPTSYEVTEIINCNGCGE